MSPQPKNIFFSVGEPSGDQHAARLVESLRRLDPSIRMQGFGGQSMQAAGCQIDLDLTQHAVVGLLEVLPKLRQFFAFADQAEEVFQGGDVDAVVLVDFPGFNWHIAKRAKRYDIPVYYYCPPQLWAWGGWRTRKMRRTVDHVLAVLPVEEKYFSAAGIPSTYVGHPFFDAVHQSPLDQQLMGRLKQSRTTNGSLVAVLPGSRDHEVHRNWPMMLESIRRLHQKHPKTKFLVASYRDRQCLWCRDQLTGDDSGLPIEFFVDRTSEVIEVADCAMMVSGSVSLELMARRTPATVVYRVGRFLYTVGRLLVQTKSLTLPNLMSDRSIFPEMVSVGSEEPAIEFLTASIDAMIGDSFYYQSVLRQMDELNALHARPGASDRAAQWITDTLAGKDMDAGTASHADAASDPGRRDKISGAKLADLPHHGIEPASQPVTDRRGDEFRRAA
ncbi:Glycosyl transferase [Rubripirellula lacrimiformis]|uniref:Lipid-A-disaccharide synthase n=1 Tax=Rubripirellula lacrimiformis TaxID=1930273 RepID=A0A517N5A7_9BACT|nr:lipid-A-disaccharide synthase [Rubripirellula lacrimiformis]QDT02322.1 Glycosyl transferase [Rubripirellula lacrimiformis]